MHIQKLPRKLILALLFVCFSATPSLAQLGDVGSVLQSSQEDANKLVEAYLKPFGSGFGAGVNTGWTNTAQPHKKLGFDLTISSGLAIVPDNDLTFDIQDLNLQELEVKGGSSESSTINGPDQSGPTLAAYSDVDNDGNEEELLNFDMPPGTDFAYVPAPMIKAGVGLIKNTEVMVRYLPKWDRFEDYGTYELFGFGIKHDVKQWIPGGGLIPVDISVMYGYTTMEVGTDFRLDAEDVINGRNNIENTHPDSEWDGQRIELTTDAWSLDALVGKSLPFISVYGGVGYESSTVAIQTPGNYPTIEENTAYPQNSNDPLRVKSEPNPIDIEFKGENSLRAMVGARVRFAIFHVSASYTQSTYSSYNVGVGISFR